MMIGKAAKMLTKCIAIGLGVAAVKQQKKKKEIKQESKQEIQMRENYDDRLDVLRNHWNSEALMVDNYTSETKEEAVADEDLLPGELSAVTFRIGNYTIRDAWRVYKILNAGYDPDGEPPADAKDIARIKNEQEKLIPSYLNELRIVNEISARNENDSQDEFTFICRAAEARNGYWRENIEYICVAKENTTVADSEASLFVLNIYMGDSFRVDTWYKLDHTGNITKLYLHPMNPDIDKEKFV